MSIEQIVVITGAAGRIGRAVVPLLRRPGRQLRLVDTAAPPLTNGDEPTWHAASIEDLDSMAAVLEGASALVHLAGLSSERPWRDLLRVNIDGTHTVLEAARIAGVPNVLLASSIHAVGFEPVARAADPRPLAPRPDTYYGVSKAAMEALGSLYADRFGMSIVSARICTFQEEPGDGRAIAQWLSPGDAARLIDAAVALRDGRHHIVWGVSANAPAWFDLSAGHAVGYHPVDDALRASIRCGRQVQPVVDRPIPLGGAFTDEAHPVGGTW